METCVEEPRQTFGKEGQRQTCEERSWLQKVNAPTVQRRTCTLLVTGVLHLLALNRRSTV